MSILEIFENDCALRPINPKINISSDSAVNFDDNKSSKAQSTSTAKVGIYDSTKSAKLEDVSLSPRYISKSRNFTSRDIHDHFYGELSKARGQARALANLTKDIVKTSNTTLAVDKIERTSSTSIFGGIPVQHISTSKEWENRQRGSSGLSVMHQHGADQIPPSQHDLHHNTINTSTMNPSQTDKNNRPKEESGLLEMVSANAPGNASRMGNTERSSYGTL